MRDSLALEKADPVHEKYHGIFLSHTGIDKPFVRQLRKDLLAHGVEHIWLDEAEIDTGDSLIAKIEEGMKLSRYIAVVLSKKSIGAPWVSEIYGAKVIQGGPACLRVRQIDAYPAMIQVLSIQARRQAGRRVAVSG